MSPKLSAGWFVLCWLIGHRWQSAQIGPRTVAAIECRRCGALRFGGPFR